MPEPRLPLTKTLQPIFWFLAGIALLILAVTNPRDVSPLRRTATGAGALLMLFISTRYYWPVYRKRREQLYRELDDMERESDELDRGAK